MIYALIALLPIAYYTGWYVRSSTSKEKNRKKIENISKDYLVGLNYLLNEQTDKAVDIFIKMLQVDSDTVETHLALGNLFRRRGEADRAIRIHQNLIARPQLNKHHRTQALLALGQDYLRAGVFDRAEKLFLEVNESGEKNQESLRFLLTIYEQERDWNAAIATAEKLKNHVDDALDTIIAHYYCELAIEARLKVGSEQAFRLLKKAQSTDKQCVRANLLSGDWEKEQENYKAAIKYYKKIVEQDSDFISEIVGPLALCYEKIARTDEYLAFLRECLSVTPKFSIILTLSHYLQQSEGDQAAANFVAEHLHHRPSIHGLKRLIELQKNFTEGLAKYNLQLLQDLLTEFLKDKPIYQCIHCGNAGKLLDWLCPSCKRWSTVKPIQGVEGD